MEKYLLTVRTSLPKMQTTDSRKITFWTFLYVFLKVHMTQAMNPIKIAWPDDLTMMHVCNI